MFPCRFLFCRFLSLFLFPLLRSLPLYLLQFTLQFSGLVFIVTIVLTAILLVFFRIRIYVPSFF